MKIQVAITTWLVPFDQTIQEIRSFDNDKDALDFINEQARLWWDMAEGDRSVAEMGGEPFEPVKELGYDHARYEVWGGEQGFHAMLDQDTYTRLHNDHYQREFTSKGRPLPGYLQNAYQAMKSRGN